MSTSSVTNSLLSSLGVSSNESISQLLGENSSTSTTNSSTSSAIQDAVNAILNSATNTAGSGIDVQSTVDAILQIDAQPEINLQNQVTSLNTQTSALQGLQSDLTAFQTSLQALTNPTGDFGGLTVSSSDNNVVSATAANGTEAETHTITVTHLATTAADYSASFASPNAPIPTGTLTLQVGSNAAVNIPVDSADSTNTLNGLAAYINSENLGVTAAVFTDGTGTRLALESQTSGAPGAITLTDNTTADYSGTFASASATLPTGEFDLQVGTNNAVVIPVNSANGTNTLTGLAAYINQQNVGATASVVTTASGASLALIPQSSGTAGVITISNDTTGSDGDGMGFSETYNPASPHADTGIGFTQAVVGSNALFSVDGIPINSSSNTVTGAIPGVTLTLSGTSSTPVTLQTAPNLSPIATDINNFVSSWNTLIGAINTGIQFNSSTGTAGTLTGDTSVDLLQQQLLGAISASMSGNNGVVNLQSIGIEMQDDGTLSVDSTTLNNALQNNFSAVQNLFQSATGVGHTLQTALTPLTNTVSSPLAVDLNGINDEVTDLNSQISDFQLQLQNTQTQLLSEYDTINTTLEQLPETLASINSQLDALNPQNSNSNS